MSAGPRDIEDEIFARASVGTSWGGAEEAFWTARPELAHVRTFARARRAGPWAVLDVVLARVVTAVGPHITLPPLVGGEVSLNLYSAIVAPSGGGKDAAIAAGTDAFDLGVEVEQLTPGSGEGIAHAFVRKERDKAAQEERIVFRRRAALFTINEITTLGALSARTGATLFPELRLAWMGSRLGFQYADPDKRLPVPAHTYRLCLIAGVQPLKASVLLDDTDGGTPQRFVFSDATDPDAPDVAPPEPCPRSWQRPVAATFEARRQIHVCEDVRKVIDAERLGTLRGTTPPLQGHHRLVQLKEAAALALLAGRVDVNEEDWQLAEVKMAHSLAVRDELEHAIARRSSEQNVARAEAEATRAIVVDERTAEAAVRRVAKYLLRRLTDKAEWITGRDLRHLVASRDRRYFDEAVERLEFTGQVDSGQIPGQGQAGMRYRKVGS